MFSWSSGQLIFTRSHALGSVCSADREVSPVENFSEVLSLGDSLQLLVPLGPKPDGRHSLRPWWVSRGTGGSRSAG